MIKIKKKSLIMKQIRPPLNYHRTNLVKKLVCLTCLMTLGPVVNGTPCKSDCSGKSRHSSWSLHFRNTGLAMDFAEELIQGYFKISLVQRFWDQQLAQRLQANARRLWIWNFLFHIWKLWILAIPPSNICNEACRCYISVFELLPRSWGCLLN